MNPDDFIPVSEIGDRLADLVDRAGEGEEFAITHNGKTVAVLISYEQMGAPDRQGAVSPSHKPTPSGLGRSIRDMGW